MILDPWRAHLQKSVVVMPRTRGGSVRGTVNISTLDWEQHRGCIGSNYIVRGKNTPNNLDSQMS
jgi:hypothetical protein